MKKKEYRSIALLIVFFVTTAVAGIWFYKSEDFTTFLIWSQDNLVLYTSIILLIKFIGVVYPPLPGSIFTIGSIPILGWGWAYAIDVTGSFLGAVTSFIIAKKYGEKVLRPFISSQTFSKLKEIKVKHKKQIESVIVMRILGGSTIVEAVNYGAGLLNISLKNFVVGFLVSHPITGIPIFYFAGNIFQWNNTYVSIAIAIISLTALYKLKGRYFE